MIETTETWIRYEGDGESTVLTADFSVYDVRHLNLSAYSEDGEERELERGRDYTATIHRDGKGFPRSAEITLAQPLAVGSFLIISRAVPMTQATSLADNRGYLPEEVEKALDLLTMIAQEISARVDRTLVVPPHLTAEGIVEMLVSASRTFAEIGAAIIALEKVIPLKADADQVAALLAGKAGIIHAARHAADGEDRITPVMIGAAADDDPRLSNSRTPRLHAATHHYGGIDEITPGAIKAMPVAPINGGPFNAVGDQWVKAPEGEGGTPGEYPYATENIFGVVKLDGVTIQGRKGVISAVPPALAHDGKVGLAIGDGVTIKTENGVLTAIIDPPPVASSTVSGTVKIDGVTIHIKDGVIFVPLCGPNRAGLVRVDNKTITITEDGTISTKPPETATYKTAGIVRIDQESLRCVDGLLSVPRGDEKTFGILRPDNKTILCHDGHIEAVQPPRGSFTEFGIFKVDGFSIVSENGILRATGKFPGGVSNGGSQTATEANWYFTEEADGYWQLAAQVEDVFEGNRFFMEDGDGFVLLEGAAENDDVRDQWFVRERDNFLTIPEARTSETEPFFALEADGMVSMVRAVPGEDGNRIGVLDDDGFVMLLGVVKDEAESDYFILEETFATLRGDVA